MSKFATITKYNIPVFEPGDVNPPRIGVDVNGRRGYLNLVDYPYRDNPSICVDLGGNRYGTARDIFEIIDNFEDNNMNEYLVEQTSGASFAEVVPGASLVSGSTLGLRLHGRKRALSLPGDGLPYYPTRGDTFEFYVRAVNFKDTPAFFRFDFGVQHYDTSDIYRLEWESEPTNKADLSLEKRENHNNVLIDESPNGTGMNLNKTYRFEINWGYNDITVQPFEMNGNPVFDPLLITDGEWDSGGIGWECQTYMVAEFDYCRTLPE